MTEKMAVVVTLGELHAGQKFIIPTSAAVPYTAATPAMVFMKIHAEEPSPFTAVNVLTGVQGSFSQNLTVLPIVY